MDLNGLNYGTLAYTGASYGAPTAPVDPNSLDALKANMQLAKEQLMRVQNLARSALAGLENAYHPGSNPHQTAADLAALKQSLHALAEFLRQTGVGALPISVSDPSSLTRQLEADIQALYQRNRRIQDSAATVVGLLHSGAR